MPDGHRLHRTTHQPIGGTLAQRADAKRQRAPPGMLHQRRLMGGGHLQYVRPEVVRMSTRCQIEFRCGPDRRTVYRHWDGYPSAVVPDLLAFLAWSTRHGDVEYESANFLFWSKRDLGARSEQLGFGICVNDELHGDIEYYYVVAWEDSGVRITGHVIERDAGDVRLGKVVASAVYMPPRERITLDELRDGAG